MPVQRLQRSRRPCVCTASAKGAGMNNSLAREHGRIEMLLERLILHLGCGDFGALWSDAVERLDRQLDFEDHLISRCGDLSNVARLRGDHHRLRELIQEIDSGYRLGVLRRELLWKLLDALRTHGVFEEEVLDNSI
jgi:hypothetical protein